MSSVRRPHYGRPVTIYPRIARFLGSNNAAVFFHQLLYWQDRCVRVIGVYKTVDEWQLETNLTYDEQRAVRRKLKERGYLIEDYRRISHKMYYLIDIDLFETELAAWQDPLGEPPGEDDGGEYTPEERKKLRRHQDEIDFKEEEVVVSKLKLSKKNRAADGKENAKEHLGNSQVPHLGNSQVDIHRLQRHRLRNKSPKGDVRSLAFPRSFDSASSAIDEVQQRLSRRREDNAAPSKERTGKAPTQKQLTATWQQVMKDHHPGVFVVPASTTDLVKMQSALKGVMATASLHEVFSFFAEYWSVLRLTKFKWLESKGLTLAAAPSLAELLRYWRVFARAFADRQVVIAAADAKSVVTDEERLRADNRQLAASVAAQAAELERVKQQLRVSDQIAKGLASAPRKAAAVRKTLGERRAALADDLPTADIPDWK